MSENEKKHILDAALDEKQLEKVSGGLVDSDHCAFSQSNLCVRQEYRKEGGCAATVEEGSSCWTGDRCSSGAVIYDSCHETPRFNDKGEPIYEIRKPEDNLNKKKIIISGPLL